jgi:hypothetical protein
MNSFEMLHNLPIVMPLSNCDSLQIGSFPRVLKVAESSIEMVRVREIEPQLQNEE